MTTTPNQNKWRLQLCFETPGLFLADSHNAKLMDDNIITRIAGVKMLPTINEPRQQVSPPFQLRVSSRRVAHDSGRRMKTPMKKNHPKLASTGIGGRIRKPFRRVFHHDALERNPSDCQRIKKKIHPIEGRKHRTAKVKTFNNSSRGARTNVVSGSTQTKQNRRLKNAKRMKRQLGGSFLPLKRAISSRISSNKWRGLSYHHNLRDLRASLSSLKVTMASMDESMKALSCSNPNPSTKVHARHRKEGRAMTSKKDPNDQHKHSKRSRASTTTSEKKREKRKAEIKRLILESRDATSKSIAQIETSVLLTKKATLLRDGKGKTGSNAVQFISPASVKSKSPIQADLKKETQKQNVLVHDLRRSLGMKGFLDKFMVNLFGRKTIRGKRHECEPFLKSSSFRTEIDYDDEYREVSLRQSIGNPWYRSNPLVIGKDSRHSFSSGIRDMSHYNIISPLCT